MSKVDQSHGPSLIGGRSIVGIAFIAGEMMTRRIFVDPEVRPVGTEDNQLAEGDVGISGPEMQQCRNLSALGKVIDDPAAIIRHGRRQIFHPIRRIVGQVSPQSYPTRATLPSPLKASTVA